MSPSLGARDTRGLLGSVGHPLALSYRDPTIATMHIVFCWAAFIDILRSIYCLPGILTTGHYQTYTWSVVFFIAPVFSCIYYVTRNV